MGLNRHFRPPIRLVSVSDYVVNLKSNLKQAPSQQTRNQKIRKFNFLCWLTPSYESVFVIERKHVMFHSLSVFMKYTTLITLWLLKWKGKVICRCKERVKFMDNGQKCPLYDSVFGQRFLLNDIWSPHQMRYLWVWHS